MSNVIAFRVIPVTEIHKGMEIRPHGDKNKKFVTVERVKHDACNTGGTHVNGSLCFDRIGMVEVKL